MRTHCAFSGLNDTDPRSRGPLDSMVQTPRQDVGTAPPGHGQVCRDWRATAAEDRPSQLDSGIRLAPAPASGPTFIRLIQATPPILRGRCRRRTSICSRNASRGSTAWRSPVPADPRSRNSVRPPTQRAGGKPLRARKRARALLGCRRALRRADGGLSRYPRVGATWRWGSAPPASPARGADSRPNSRSRSSRRIGGRNANGTPEGPAAIKVKALYDPRDHPRRM